VTLVACKNSDVDQIDEPINNDIIQEELETHIKELEEINDELLSEISDFKLDLILLSEENKALLLENQSHTEEIVLANEKDDDGMTYITTYIKTPELTREEVVSLYFDAMQTDYNQLWLATLTERSRRNYRELYTTGTLSIELLEMEVVDMGEDRRVIESEAKGCAPEDITVVLVAYEAYYDHTLTWLDNGITISQFYLVREDSNAPWLIDDQGFGFVDEAFENMIEKYADYDLAASISGEVLIGLIASTTDYEELLSLYIQYGRRIDGAPAEMYAVQLHTLFIENGLEGFLDDIDMLSAPDLDVHAMFLVSELSRQEGYETIKAACNAAKLADPNNQHIIEFSEAVDYWIQIFD
ncbi:MAG: DUF4829 domain-containing protein, partial [Vallitaleaceae bacterium]|nr:DUF4829 domain-containing protein [Vallitaleaceae bacterium]